jgi:hypothetical protein
MKKGILLTLAVLILAIIGSWVYWFYSTLSGMPVTVQKKPSPRIPTPTAVKKYPNVTLGQYQLMLPNGWQADGVNRSIIDMYVSEGVYCWLEPNGDLSKQPCYYTRASSSSYPSMHIIIADTDKLPLGGGGYVPTVLEHKTIRNAQFQYVWNGTYADPSIAEEIVKLEDDNGNPEIYWIKGCLEEDLCVAMGAQSDGKNNFWMVTEFESFVNDLKFIRTDPSK